MSSQARSYRRAAHRRLGNSVMPSMKTMRWLIRFAPRRLDFRARYAKVCPVVSTLVAGGPPLDPGGAMFDALSRDARHVGAGARGDARAATDGRELDEVTLPDRLRPIVQRGGLPGRRTPPRVMRTVRTSPARSAGATSLPCHHADAQARLDQAPESLPSAAPRRRARARRPPGVKIPRKGIPPRADPGVDVEMLIREVRGSMNVRCANG